jgi:predicted DNA-binding protein (MmcQ/YjbR family)
VAAKSQKPQAALRAYALSLPGAREEFPWGESVVKVGSKVFVFLGREGDVGISVKLPDSGMAALSLPFVEPTGYGLGKSGWVTATFPRGAGAPVGLLREWIEESYRAVAPKKRVAELDGGKPAAPKPPRAPRRSRR